VLRGAECFKKKKTEGIEEFVRGDVWRISFFVVTKKVFNFLELKNCPGDEF
jgi:hypothetical protein